MFYSSLSSAHNVDLDMRGRLWLLIVIEFIVLGSAQLTLRTGLPSHYLGLLLTFPVSFV
jgi:hypothetical protein